MRLGFFSFILCCLLTLSSHAQKPTGLYEGDTVIVYVFMLENCVITQNYTLALRQMHETYASEQIQFKGLFPNTFSTPQKITEFKKKYEISFLLTMDFDKEWTLKLGASVTPTAVVWNKTRDEVLYRGRIDDSYYRIGKRRTVTTTSELADALAAIVSGEEIRVKETKAIGCFINFKL